MLKHLKNISLLMFFLLTSAVALAQAGMEDVVYLKNGSIIHGIIVEQIPNQSIKIQTKDNNVFIFKMDEIEKMTKENTSGGSSSSENKSDNQPAKKQDLKNQSYTGYSFGIETQMGHGVGNEANGLFNFSAHVLNGATINSMFFIGAGLGFDFMNIKTLQDYSYYGYNSYSTDPYLFLSYYIDFKAFPVKGKISPLVIIDYGYSSNLMFIDNSMTGGMLFNGGLGARLAFSKRMGLNISMNYKIQKASYSGTYYDNLGNYVSNNQALNMHFMCLTIGLNL